MLKVKKKINNNWCMDVIENVSVKGCYLICENYFVLCKKRKEMNK